MNRGHIDINEFLIDAFNNFEQKIYEIVNVHYLVKLSTCFVAVFEKISFVDGEEIKEYQTLYLHSEPEVLDFETDLSNFYRENIIVFVQKKIDDIELRGSGFTLSEIRELNIQISRFEPIAGSSYIELPKVLKCKKAIVNVQNEDNQCFKYAVLSAIFPASKNAQRVSKYKRFEHLLDWTGVDFPKKFEERFEQRNPLVSINVYMFDFKEREIRSLRLTKDIKSNHIHLLVLTKTINEGELGFYSWTHYCWIKNLSALLSRQISKNCARKIFCDRCLNYFIRLEDLEMHLSVCMQQNECQIEMPTEENNQIKFENYPKQLQVPFIIYADLESILKKPEKRCSESESTFAYQEHEAHSIGYYLKCTYDDSRSYYRSNRGKNCIRWFVREIHRIARDIEPILNRVVPLNMTLEDEVFFIVSDDCHICGEMYVDTDIRVRDHSHLTGKYRGSAHSNCNLQYKDSRKIPVVFHNLSNYDAHFIVKALAKGFKGNVSVIPRTDEHYISFTKTVPSAHTKDYARFIKFRFIDSFRFMASSLDYLSSLIPAGKKKILHFECSEMSPTQIQLLERKGVFCYEYVDSWGKLDEKKLPSKDNFYSKLTDSQITDEDYEFACRVWNEIEIETLGEYSDLYLKTDILLLADVFENFRRTCYDIYKLDPAHYYTAPGLSFDAMLKYTKVEIELLTDIDMLLFVEKGIRGGISQCSKRYSKANNKYMSDYDAMMMNPSI